MASSRVTITVPTEIRDAAREAAANTGRSLSAVVGDALALWVRYEAMNHLMAEYEAENGAFTEDDIKEAATELGLPHVPPVCFRVVA